MNALARFVVFGSLPVVALVAGCTSQGEGDRCSSNADCQSEFFCFMPTQAFGVCCSGTSTLAACNPGVSTSDSGAGMPDAQTESSTEEAAAEAGPDGGAESGVDAASNGAVE